MEGGEEQFKELERLREGNIRDSIIVRQCIQEFICK
jgi:hypothetical protein